MRDADNLQNGISRRELDQLWTSRGGEIRPVRRTGEVRYIDPTTGDRSSCFNNRRKDVPRAVVAWVRKHLPQPPK